MEFKRVFEINSTDRHTHTHTQQSQENNGDVEGTSGEKTAMRDLKKKFKPKIPHIVNS